MPVVPPKVSVLSRWLALGLGCGFFGLYVITAAPGLYWMDSGELTAAGYGLGVAHPPGFALYILLSKAATLLPFGSIAFRVVLLSALCGGATVALVFWLALRLGLALGSSERVAQGASVGAALVLGLSHSFWRQSTVAEVYTPSLLILALSLVLLLPALERRSGRLSLALAFLAGLAVGGAHPTFRLLVFPPLLVAWVVGMRRGRRYSRAVPLFFGLGAMVVLTLVAVAGQGHGPDWGHCTSLSATWDHFAARRIQEASFEPLMFSFRSEIVAPHLSLAVDQILGQFIGIALPLAGLGAWRGLCRPGPVRVVVAVLLFAGLGDFVYSFWVNPMGLRDLQNGFTFALCLAVLAGVGVSELAAWIGHHSPRIAPAVAAACCVIMALPTALDSLPEKTRGAGYGAAGWVDAALDQAPPRAVVFTGSDDLSAGWAYARLVEGARPDVLSLVRQHLWVTHYTARWIRADRDGDLPGRRVAEYGQRPRRARHRSRLNLLALLVDNVAGRRPILWEPGDGADLSALRRPLTPDVPLFRVHTARGRAPSPAPAALVARLRRILPDPGHRASQVRARQLNALGMQALRMGSGAAVLDTARRFFALALEQWPASVAARVNGGVVLARAADGERAAGRERVAMRLLFRAARVTEKALALEPNRYTALLNAGRFRLRLAQGVAVRSPAEEGRQAALARRHFARARLLHPHRSAPHFHLGVIAARASRFAEARRHFRKAVELDPRDEIARSYLRRVEKRLQHK
jgi:4-amino-4-deoxy-L-arabinose transferase-like glycosyltransferase